MQSVTPQVLEQHVLAKPWFDRNGLIVACDGARPVGFAHAGFGADCEQRQLDCSQGTTCLLLIAPHEQRPQIAQELLAASEDYLRRRGAKQLYAGSQFPLNPFYLGLYGSSDTASVLASNKGFVELLLASGYQPKHRRVMAGRTLAGFRPPVDREQLQVRRRFKLAGPTDVLPDNWWDASVWALHELSRFDLVLPDGGEPIVSATLWDIDPLAASWGVRTVGLIHLDDTPEAREAGLSTFLLSEVLRQYQASGYAHFEAQAASEDESLLELFDKLGLIRYDQGALWLKTP